MTDTSPKRLRELAEAVPTFAQLFKALAAEKESAVCSSLCHPDEPCSVSPDGKCPVCPTCGSDCNERDELIKAEREIERLRAEIRQRERMNARFANRAPSPPTADFDLPHESDDAAGHTEQPLQLAKPADVPLPEPLFLLHCEDEPGEWDVEANSWVAVEQVAVRNCGKTVGLITVEAAIKYGQACAKAARDAAFEECAHICEKVSDQLGDGTRIETAAEGGAYQCVIAIQAAKKGTP